MKQIYRAVICDRMTGVATKIGDYYFDRKTVLTIKHKYEDMIQPPNDDFVIIETAFVFEETDIKNDSKK